MRRRLMRTSLRLDGPAAGMLSTKSPEPRESRRPPTCRGVRRNWTSANPVVRQTVPRKAKTVQRRKRRLKRRAAERLLAGETLLNRRSHAVSPGRSLNAPLTHQSGV